MSNLNIARMMIPKPCTRVLHEKDSVRQGLETMAHHGYTAIPVLDENEHYIGCVSEGDFLNHILKQGTTDLKYHEQFLVKEILRKDFCPAIYMSSETSTIVKAISNQNFLPVVDDRNVLCGILTRRAVILELAKEE